MGRPRRGGARVRQRPGALGRHPPLRAPDVRDHGRLGDGPDLAEHSPVTRDYAQIWQAADKIVFSRTLRAAATTRTRIERDFDPDAVRALKAGATRDLSVGGAELAAHAFAAGLVDELQLFVVPVLVGGGKRALPDHTHLKLELLDERRFAGGVVYLRYRTIAQAESTDSDDRPGAGAH